MNLEVLRNLNPIDIQKYQANRYPWFFVDMIEEIIIGKHARGFKNFLHIMNGFSLRIL